MVRAIVRWSLVLLWLVLLFSAVHVSGRKAGEWVATTWRLVDKPPFSEVSPEFLDVISLGHKSVIDDALLFHTLNYLTEPSLKSTPPEEVLAALKGTTRLKPRIETIYMFGCLVLAFDLDAPHMCESVILDGIGLFPDGWRLPVTLGTVLYHKLNDDAKAAIFYEMAADKPYSPPFAKSFAAKLRNRSAPDPAEVEAIISALRGVVGVIDEDRIKQFYRDGVPVAPEGVTNQGGINQ